MLKLTVYGYVLEKKCIYDPYKILITSNPVLVAYQEYNTVYPVTKCRTVQEGKLAYSGCTECLSATCEELLEELKNVLL